jgi:protein-arginine kinase activator protein McsA
MIESLIDKRLDKVKNTKDNIRADIRQKKETILNPALIFRPSNLQERCDKCGSTLESFLRQITAGCSYCFVNFSKYLDEYIESVKMSMKTEEKNNDEKERTYVSTKKQIEILEIVKQEAIAQQNWTRAAECRDSILALNKKKKKGKKNAN